VWHDLNDVDPVANARGSAGALLLALALGTGALVALGLGSILQPFLRRFAAAGPSRLTSPYALATVTLTAACFVYLAVLGLLIVMSLAVRWPYPALMPDQLNVTAWTTLGHDASPLWLSLFLATATTLTGLAIVIVWFETQSAAAGRWLPLLALVALGLPQILIVTGQYRLFLALGLTGSLTGLLIAHLTPVLAYVAIVLAGPYRGFDQRYAAVARSLRAGPWRLWWRIKAPLLRGPLLTAAAVGFGVSMVQFLPAQLIAAGRYSTLPMEAVNLAAGGNRSLTAVFALALALPPLLAFAAAGTIGRQRWP
jgi:putative thiamine transport system permease protein